MTDFVRMVPDGDTRERLVCATCGFIDYQNRFMIKRHAAAFNTRE